MFVVPMGRLVWKSAGMNNNKARTTRREPFCWQAKSVLRILRKHFSGSDLAKYRNLYLTLTEIDSDFNGKPFDHFTKTISTYSGLSRDFIPQALRVLESMGIISTEEKRDSGKFSGKSIDILSVDEIKQPDFPTSSEKDEKVVKKSRKREKQTSSNSVQPQKEDEDAVKTVAGKTVAGDSAHKKIKRTKNKKQKIAPSGAVTGKSNKLDKKSVPQTRQQFIESCKKNSSPHIRVIGWMASKQSNLTQDTKGKWDLYLARHLKSASKITAHTPEEIQAAYEDMCKQNYIDDWSLETLIKRLTNGKKQDAPEAKPAAHREYTGV